ncbi:MAG: 4-hydroxythreonine-4-phosphate dehydrogenase [Planctomycetota bacterium]|jgi:4-hydroxythreonine-4-phosphate dehydrogenase
MSLPLLALTLGDPAGIGPEIAAKALARPELAGAARVLVVGPPSARPGGLEDAPDDLSQLPGIGFRATAEVQGSFVMGAAQANCGRAALEALALGAELAQAGLVDGLVTGPVCKEAMHMAGEPVEGQTELLARWADCERFEMMAVAGDLRVMLLTRHMPLTEAIRCLDPVAIDGHLGLFHETLQGLGIEAPRLAVAGLNPHAGEGGLLGEEDAALVAPGVRAAQARGLNVSGPRSPDTVFLEASEGRWDGVLALYHDQGFIPLKLLSQGRGVTLIAGLPYLRVSPVHGTAFDIAGEGLADEENLLEALLQASRWANSAE